MPRRTTTDLSQHIDPFGNLNHFDLYAESKNSNSLAPVIKNAIDLSGRIALSAALKFPMSFALSLSIAKAMDVPYAQGAKNFWNTTRGYKETQANNLLNHRTRTSLIPVTFTSAIAEELDLPPAGLVAVNTALESTFAALTRESSTRFHAINAKKYCFTDEKGKGVNLINLSQEKFNQFCQNHEETKNFGDKEWNSLQKRIKTYHENWEIRAKALILRNGIFSASIFLTQPLAQKFVAAHGDAIERNTQMSREAISTTSDCAMRLGLACLTTCFDRVFSRVSSGKISAAEITAEIKQNLKNGDFNKAFGGGASRLAFVTMSLGTLVAGPNVARDILKAIDYVWEGGEKKIPASKLLGPLHFTAQEVSKSCQAAAESCRQDEPSTDAEKPNAQQLKQSNKSRS